MALQTVLGAEPIPNADHCRARTLWEQLAVEGLQACDSDTVKLWCDRVAAGNSDIFRKRLRLAGLDPKFDKPFERASNRPPPVVVPPYLNSSACIPLERPFPPQSKLLSTFLDKCSRQDTATLIDNLRRVYPLKEEAVWALRKLLHQRLMQVSTHVIALEFRRYKRQRGTHSLSGDARFLGKKRDAELASEFLSVLIAVGLPYLRASYPVWARLVDAEVLRWYNVTLQVLSRLSTDQDHLVELCGVERGVALVGIEAGGDRHRGGQCVFILTFSCQRKVVYKPRSLALDEWYGDLLSWFSSCGDGTLDLYSPRVVDKGSYGWSRFIEHSQVADREAESRYYRRLGMLLCLWTLLGGGDCHFENIIASGEYPVIIDAETLFDAYAGAVIGFEGKGIGEQLSRKIADSVKRVGLLPRYLQINQSADPIDLSALGMRAPLPAPFGPEDGHTADAQSLGIASAESFFIQPRGNLPREAPEALGKERIKAVCAGFEDLYNLVIRYNQEFVARLKQLKTLPHARVRMIMRQTNLYSRLLEQSLYPEYLRLGTRRSIELDRLSKRFTDQRFSRLNCELSAAETEALEALDIPLFDVPLNAPSRKPSCDRQGRLNRGPSGNPLTSAIRRVQGVSLEDKQFQRRLIEEILVLDDAQKYPESAISSTFASQITTSRGNFPLGDEIVRTVTEVEQSITAASFSNSRGEMGWLAPIPTFRDGYYDHRWTGYGLYAGSAGNSIFYAALYKVLRADQFREKAIASISPLNNAILNRKRRGGQEDLNLLRDSYAAGVVATLLNDSSLVQPAISLAQEFNPRTLRYDSTFDVLGGAAGALLSVMALHSNGPSRSLLKVARAIGDHLLAKRIVVNDSFRVWKTLDAPLIGFAHGVSGIALALLRLADFTGDARYSSAAEEALAYESSLFNTTLGNWPDLRHAPGTSEISHRACAWCHGATGIGMARIAMGALTRCSASSPRATQLGVDISRAKQATLAIAKPPLEHLCCGEMGRAAFLDLLARNSGDEEAGIARDEITHSVMSRPVSSWRMVQGVNDLVVVPGFFNGMAGVGYELLRMYIDSSLPCILTWDACGESCGGVSESRGDSSSYPHSLTSVLSI